MRSYKSKRSYQSPMFSNNETFADTAAVTCDNRDRVNKMYSLEFHDSKL